MFTTIYKYELKHWLQQPTTYIYALVIFLISMATMWGLSTESSGYFRGRLANSPMQLHKYGKLFIVLVTFILPAFIGVSIHRDYNSNMHSLLYSFPFKKLDFLLAKFLSAFTIIGLLLSMIILGFLVGPNMPFTNPEVIGATRWDAFAQLFFVYYLPNLFLFSVVIFAVVMFTRNIYSGFIAVFVVIILQAIIGPTLDYVVGNPYLSALLDPFGIKPMEYYTQYWTVRERNKLPIPIHGVVMQNRVLWMSVASLIFVWTIRKFTFHQNAFSLKFRSRSGERMVKNNFGSITKVNLPTIKTDFSFIQQLKNTWQLSNFDFQYILRSGLFISMIIGGGLFVLFSTLITNSRFGTHALPITSVMLETTAQFYGGFMNLMTFLFAGMLIHRARFAKMDSLVDVTPIPNWSLLLSKFIALIKMQMVLLSLLMIGGIITQISKGYYDFDIGQYLMYLFGISLVHYVIWGMFAVFIQSMFSNAYIGFFFLILAPIGMILPMDLAVKMGHDWLTQGIFRYNQGPGQIFGLLHSDMDGYGGILPAYFIHKLYWLLAGSLLLIGASLLWIRGIPFSIRERMRIARSRFGKGIALTSLVLLIAFMSLGYGIYHENNVVNEFHPREKSRIQFFKKQGEYRQFEKTPQPKIISVKANVDLFPEERSFSSTGSYVLVNRTDKNIDTMVVIHLTGVEVDYHFDRSSEFVFKEKVANYVHFHVMTLEKPLLPNDTMIMNFAVKNKPNTILTKYDKVKNNGTLMRDEIFPRIGNWMNPLRSILDIHHSDDIPHPSDSTAHYHSWGSMDSDRIDYEAIVSTSPDQIAVTPGYLQREWTENGRRYFHYKMDQKIDHSFVFMSGKYEVLKEQWKGIDLEIYYDKKHHYNLNRMMEGMKQSLDYCSKNFSPYQFKQCRIIEFAQVGGATAHGYPNTIPTGEGAGFIADIDNSEEGGVDFAFGTAVHEVAHQWWGNQVTPASTLGSKMIVEGMAEYVTVMVRKQEEGVKKMRQYLKGNMSIYLRGRSSDMKGEQPFMYCKPSQGYIAYTKGAILLKTFSDLMGEEKFNQTISEYVNRVKFQEGPYTTTIDFVEHLRAATPDSLQYLIKDIFETITLYDNRVHHVTTTLLPNGKYQVDMEFFVSKYRSNEYGDPKYSDNALDSLSYQFENEKESIYSLPLADFIEIGINGENEEEIYLQKHKITSINNKVSFVVNKKPTEIVLDPNFQMIDTDVEDNRRFIN